MNAIFNSLLGIAFLGVGAAATLKEDRMLVLTRKLGEQIHISDGELTVTVLANIEQLIAGGGQISLGLARKLRINFPRLWV
jgi:hypothetical protein